MSFFVDGKQDPPSLFIKRLIVKSTSLFVQASMDLFRKQRPFANGTYPLSVKSCSHLCAPVTLPTHHKPVDRGHVQHFLQALPDLNDRIESKPPDTSEGLYRSPPSDFEDTRRALAMLLTRAWPPNQRDPVYPLDRNPAQQRSLRRRRTFWRQPFPSSATIAAWRSWKLHGVVPRPRKLLRPPVGQSQGEETWLRARTPSFDADRSGESLQ